MHLLLFAALLLPPQEDLKQLQAVVNTSAGTFVMEFYPEQAPYHVRKFIELARQGFYSGTRFIAWSRMESFRAAIRKPKIAGASEIRNRRIQHGT